MKILRRYWRELLAVLYVLVGIVAIYRAAYAGDLKSATGWNLVAVSSIAGGDPNPPQFIPCRRNTDYLKGVIPTRDDCWSDGEYKTLAECLRAVGPNSIDLIQESVRKYVIVKYLCAHKKGRGT